MSQPTITKCHDNIVKDPTLLWLFPEEWMSVWELPLLGTLQFKIILERLFAHIASPAIWGKAWVQFITSNIQKISEEAIPMAILVTDGVGEGNLGMVTTFCQHDQAKMEASNALSALHQGNLLEPSVVVVRQYTNTPYILWQSSHLSYLDISTLFGGTSSTWFPLDWLHLCRLIPFSNTEMVLPWEEGDIGLKVFPYFQEAPWQNSEEEHCVPNLILLLVPSSAPPSPSRRVHQDGGRVGLSPSPQVFTRCQSSQSSAGVWVGLGNTGVSLKIWW